MNQEKWLYPSEEQIDSVISEMLNANETAHPQKGEAVDDIYASNHHCEMCDFSRHLNAMNKTDVDGVEPNPVDQLMMRSLDRMPMVKMVVLATGGVEQIFGAARAIFYLGFKVGRNYESNKQLTEAFGEFPK